MKIFNLFKANDQNKTFCVYMYVVTTKGFASSHAMCKAPGKKKTFQKILKGE